MKLVDTCSLLLLVGVFSIVNSRRLDDSTRLHSHEINKGEEDPSAATASAVSEVDEVTNRRRKKESPTSEPDYYFSESQRIIETLPSSEDAEVIGNGFESTRATNHRNKHEERSRGKKNRNKHKRNHRKQEEDSKDKRKNSPDNLQFEFNSVGPTPSDYMNIAKHHAMRVIWEKMYIAFGAKFMEANKKIPSNITLLFGDPTMTSLLTMTTEPCPAKFVKCSSEIFYSTCDPPHGAHKGLWKRRFNLYFDLPNNILEDADELLNGTIRIYKNQALPLRNPIDIMVDIYSYTTSFTKKRDWNILVNSAKVTSDYIGWVSLDVTEWARRNNPDKNFGFLIKISDDQGFLWDAPSEFFEQRNCSGDSLNYQIAVPFEANSAEKGPSLTIHTGMLDHYYSDRTEELFENYEDLEYDSRENNDTSSTQEEGDEDYYLGSDDDNVDNVNYEEEQPMYHQGEDLEVHNQRKDTEDAEATTLGLPEDRQSIDDEEEEYHHPKPKVVRVTHKPSTKFKRQRYNHQRQVLIQKPSSRIIIESETFSSPSINRNRLSSLEDSGDDRTTKRKISDKDKLSSSSDSYETRIVTTSDKVRQHKRNAKHSRKRHSHGSHSRHQRHRLHNQFINH